MKAPFRSRASRHALLATATIFLFASCGGAISAPTAATRSVDPATSYSAADLHITTPLDGAVVTSSTIIVTGTAPTGVTVVHDIPLAPDDEVVVIDGSWRLGVELDEGANRITLRIGDQEDTAQDINLTFTPEVALATQPATFEPTPEVTPTPTAKPTPKPTAEPTPKPITYATLSARNWAKIVKSPDSYIGRGYSLWGCISQFDAATGSESFLANASYKKQSYWYLYGENVLFTGDEARLSDFVEGDVVYMKVLSLGSFSYDTQIGGNTTVPLFDVVSIARKGSCA